MALTFITGNAGKFAEAKAVLGIELTQTKLDLPEVQDLDPYVVMQHKLDAAKAYKIFPCIVEDSSLTLKCLQHKLPGPFIKAFEDALGVEGIVLLTQKFGESRATGRTLVGYVDEGGDTYLFDGTIDGEIVPPRGTNDFGYGPIFKPEGSEMTFGEMEREEKYALSSRGIAMRKLKEHLGRA
ncbi:non-canonical purine NTP pyrophosphatase [Patescibacteria group bacterium]|nr:non-canonical purine NTP pyrophosphatase [Patescibacteria group bacterium]MBU1500710.1 non-canonical purine NTP pyrophosphatase [Patescibacteria group bacterium]MBU2080972.1 non-canonical purine NTP pyrophosphatase [Patescibacteria group bacterium]MBU2124240.1 non-canonical purine NTP pyrophosphatase [Patescibacteria group bacterium]MBU2195033.1 non-canonical purine NTP pyrophosphatase [Patescibacteria group bacterium]